MNSAQKAAASVQMSEQHDAAPGRCLEEDDIMKAGGRQRTRSNL